MQNLTSVGRESRPLTRPGALRLMAPAGPRRPMSLPAGDIRPTFQAGGPAGLGGNGDGPGPRVKRVLFKDLLRAEFLRALRTAFPDLALTDALLRQLVVSDPRGNEHGEYSIAVFPLAKVLARKPQEISLAIKDVMERGAAAQYFDLAQVGPYINLKFSAQFLLSGIHEIDAELGQNDKMAGLTVLVEWVSANPTGPLHIGHGRWAVMGDTICRMLEACGAAVTREFYINDAGAQIQRFRDSVTAVREGRPVPEEGYHGAYVAELARSEADPVAAMLSSQRQTLAQIGVRFDNWFSETTLHAQNKVAEAVALLDSLGLTYRAELTETTDEDGEPNAERHALRGEAVWFRSTQFGDDKDRVLVRSDGRPTYFAADVAYHLDKVQRNFGLLINIFGADHGGYVQRLSAAINALSQNRQPHQIIIGQLVKIFRGTEEVRMSKRTGEMITLSDLIEELGPDAVRVFMSIAGFDTALKIDMKAAVQKNEDNPYYYLEYAHARISQILLKAGAAGFAPATEAGETRFYSLDAEERDLLAYLFKFPDVVCAAAERRDVSAIIAYAVDLSKLFSAFYSLGVTRGKKVVDVAEPAATRTRLAMVRAVQQVFKNAFALIGITPLDKMSWSEERVK